VSEWSAGSQRCPLVNGDSIGEFENRGEQTCLCLPLISLNFGRHYQSDGRASQPSLLRMMRLT
jgi:hypothetical protein